MERFRLDKERATLVVIDIQEKLIKPMKYGEQVLNNISILVEAAKNLGLPIVVTEQYPKGLGKTLPPFPVSIPDFSPIEKMTFSCCGSEAFSAKVEALAKSGRDSFVISGAETHICVLQTVLDLLGKGYKTHVPDDAVCSRRKQNWLRALSIMDKAGATVTCTETVIFQLYGRAGTPEFKEISRLLK